MKPPQIALIIDDEKQIRRLLRIVLEDAGYRVFEALIRNEAGVGYRLDAGS